MRFEVWKERTTPGDDLSEFGLSRVVPPELSHGVAAGDRLSAQSIILRYAIRRYQS